MVIHPILGIQPSTRLGTSLLARGNRWIGGRLGWRDVGWGSHVLGFLLVCLSKRYPKIWSSVMLFLLLNHHSCLNEDTEHTLSRHLGSITMFEHTFFLRENPRSTPRYTGKFLFYLFGGLKDQAISPLVLLPRVSFFTRHWRHSFASSAEHKPQTCSFLNVGSCRRI